MLVLNAVDFLLKDVSLSEVRSRTLPNSPLDIGSFLYRQNIQPDRIAQVESKVKLVVKGINIILPSLLLILYGLMRLLQLKRSRREIQNRFQPIRPLTREASFEDENSREEEKPAPDEENTP